MQSITSHPLQCAFSQAYKQTCLGCCNPSFCSHQKNSIVNVCRKKRLFCLWDEDSSVGLVKWFPLSHHRFPKRRKSQDSLGIWWPAQGQQSQQLVRGSCIWAAVVAGCRSWVMRRGTALQRQNSTSNGGWKSFGCCARSSGYDTWVCFLFHKATPAFATVAFGSASLLHFVRSDYSSLCKPQLSRVFSVHFYIQIMRLLSALRLPLYLVYAQCSSIFDELYS